MPFIRVTNLSLRPLVISDPTGKSRLVITVPQGGEYQNVVPQADYDLIQPTLLRLKITGQLLWDATFYDPSDATGGNGGGGTSDANDLSFTPATPTDWNPVPPTGASAFDQLAARAPLVPNTFPQINIPTQAPQRIVIYVRPGGNDVTGDGASPATAFRTVQHALNTVPVFARGPRYVIDITGINDTNQAIVFPPYINGDPFAQNNTPEFGPFFKEGYVSINATPTALDALNQGTTTGLIDPMSQLTVVTDTSKAWTIDQWKGKIICDSSGFGYGIIYHNTATQLFTTSLAGDPNIFPFTFPVQIYDYGATLSGIGFQSPVFVDSVKAKIAFHGIQLTSPNLGGLALSDSDSVYLQLCQVRSPRLNSGGLIEFDGCYVQGSGTGVQVDSIFETAQHEGISSYYQNLTPASQGQSTIFEYCCIDNCYPFDGPTFVEYALSQILGKGIVCTGASATAIFDVRIDNVLATPHINPNGSAIHIMGGASVNLAEGKLGGAGNAGYGVEVSAQGCAWMEQTEPVNLTVTGALGDLKVGNRPPRSWVDFNANPPIQNEIDLSHLARCGLNVGGATVGAEVIGYTPTTPANWPEGAPTTSGSALDKLAVRTAIDEQNAGYALQFITKPMTGDALQVQAVICGGPFVPDATDLAPCLYEAWAAPGDDDPGIIFVIGIGGLHAMLLEFTSSGPGTQNPLSGNMMFDDPGQGIGFGSYDGLWPGEPGHVAAMWDGTNVLLFVNGLCSGKFPTPVGFHRRSQSTASGGILCINSNGHAARGGLIQQVRIWDGLASAPPTLPKLGSNYEVFPGPESIFGSTFSFGDGTYSDCQFLMVFTQPATTVNDQSLGMLGKKHPGNLVNMRVTNSLIQGSPGNVYPRPKYVAAPLFPSGLVDTPRIQPIFNKPASAQPTPPAVAGTLLSADDFSDGWNTYAFDNGVLFEGLGLTLPQLKSSKYGSLGALPYDQKLGYTSLNGPAAFGTDNTGNAVGLDTNPATATVDLGVADYDVMVERVGAAAPNSTNGELGIAFRRQDASNYYTLQAVYDPFAGEAMHLWMFKVVAGVSVALDNAMTLDLATPNDTWHWLRVRVKGTTFQAFVDNGSGGWTQVGSDITGQTSFATATRAGIYSASSLVTRQTTRMRTASLAIYSAP